MILFPVVPVSCSFDDSDNLLSLRRKVLLLHFLCHATGNDLLLGGIVKYGRAVFWTNFSNEDMGGGSDVRVPWSGPWELRAVGSCVQ